MGGSGEAGAMDENACITEITVRDLEASRAWYSRFLGKAPDLEPFPGNIEFKVGGAWLQIVEGEARPSTWALRIEVRDLSIERERLRAEGVDAAEIATVPTVISYFDLKDPDGNTLMLFQVLTSDPKVTGKPAGHEGG